MPQDAGTTNVKKTSNVEANLDALSSRRAQRPPTARRYVRALGQPSTDTSKNADMSASGQLLTYSTANTSRTVQNVTSTRSTDHSQGLPTEASSVELSRNFDGS